MERKPTEETNNTRPRVASILDLTFHSDRAKVFYVRLSSTLKVFILFVLQNHIKDCKYDIYRIQEFPKSKIFIFHHFFTDAFL